MNDQIIILSYTIVASFNKFYSNFPLQAHEVTASHLILLFVFILIFFYHIIRHYNQRIVIFLIFYQLQLLFYFF